MNFEKVEQLVILWGQDKEIFQHSTPFDQGKKLYEELHELLGAIKENDENGIVDGIGDMLVVLTMISHMIGKDLFTCYAAAYLEIRNRRGKIVNGIFVKES